MSLQPHGADQARRRHFVLGGAAALVSTPAAAQASLARPAGRADARGRYQLSADWVAPYNEVVQLPFDATVFQSGADFALQADGKVLIQASGLYEVTLSVDWDLKAGRDIALRQTGVRRQRAGQPDLPLDAHERVISGDLPGSAAPVTARGQQPWGPVDVGPGAVVFVDVAVAPAGAVKPGDVAQASHTQIRAGVLPDDALAALVVQAKVIGADMVRVSLYNPGAAGSVQIPAGTLNVLASSTRKLAGGSGDGWHPLHSPSVVLDAGDKVYATVRHHVPGSLVQATRVSFLQVDRLE